MLRNPGWVFIILMVAGTLVLGGIALNGDWVDEGDWVGWIQAVGSIEAIVAAIALTQVQHWADASKEREKENLERDALVLELMLPLTELNHWIKEKCTSIEVCKAHSDGSTLVVSYREFLREVPRPLDSPSPRLLFLGREAGIRAIQIRELLNSCNAKAKSRQAEHVSLQGPDPKVPEFMAAIFRIVLSLEVIAQTLLDDVQRLHAKIVPE